MCSLYKLLILSHYAKTLVVISVSSNKIAHASYLFTYLFAEAMFEEGAADGESPWTCVLDELQTLVAVDAASHADGEVGVRHDGGDELLGIGCVAVA